MMPARIHRRPRAYYVLFIRDGAGSYEAKVGAWLRDAVKAEKRRSYFRKPGRIERFDHIPDVNELAERREALNAAT